MRGELLGVGLGVDLGADLAGGVSSPSTNGSCPEVQTRLPLRTAGMYAATGGATVGQLDAELGQRGRSSALIDCGRFR